MKLYTRKGDAGQTSLFDGRSVRKDDPRVAAYGSVDELNALLGWARAGGDDADMGERLRTIQAELFCVGADLATPADATSARARVPQIDEAAVRRLEQWIDEASDAAPSLRSFVLPAGAELACRLHLARTACRRAEREVVAAAADTDVNPRILVYLNRLGDLLFAWARWANHRAGTVDDPWTPPAPLREGKPSDLGCE